MPAEASLISTAVISLAGGIGGACAVLGAFRMVIKAQYKNVVSVTSCEISRRAITTQVVDDFERHKSRCRGEIQRDLDRGDRNFSRLMRVERSLLATAAHLRTETKLQALRLGQLEKHFSRVTKIYLVDQREEKTDGGK
jgi:hypothetical protein